MTGDPPEDDAHVWHGFAVRVTYIHNDLSYPQGAAMRCAGKGDPMVTKQQLIDYLESGIRPEQPATLLGIELERFIVDPATRKAISYYGERGVEQVVLKLQGAERADGHEITEVFMSEGHCLGYNTKDYSVTLEPAAQLEISVRPVADVFEYEQIYRGFQARIDPILTEFGYEILAYGYQPASKVDDLALIPKKRYRLMDEAFQQIGHAGRCMMRGTASTQVSVDYYSEEDFKRKYRIAYALRLALADLCDNIPVFEGEPNTIPHRRLEIWKSVDPSRDDVAKYLREDTMDFASYAQFVLDAPKIVPAGDADPVAHELSMVFPDVRAKKYIEIRPCDSMPLTGVMAYGITIRTLFSDIDGAQAFLNQHGGSTASDSQLSGLEHDLPAYVYAHCTDKERAFLDLHYDDFRNVTSYVRDAH